MSDRPYVDFAEVKANIPIPDALAALGLADGFTMKGKALTGVCPLPSHQHGPSPNREQFKADAKKGSWLWHCFGDCERGGDVIELVKAITGYDNAHVRFWFAEHFAEQLNLKKPRRKRNGKGTGEKAAKVEKPRALKPLSFRLDLHPGVPYLQQRGLQPETIERYGLGLCERGVLAGYVAIPVFMYPHPQDANPVGYLGRWPAEEPDDEHPRYKFPDGFPRNRVVYGLREAMAGSLTGQPLVVVEGPFKVYHCYQAGIHHTVATFGASMSAEQAELLAETGRPIVLMYDGNEAGQKGMRAAAGKLITRAYVRVVKLPEDVEPDHLAAAELKEVLSFL